MISTATDRPHVTRQDIATAFRAIGAQQGDTLLFHSSLSSMGYVEGGATAVIDGALEAVGPEGTVAVPTLWYDGHPENHRPEDFDLRTSPAWNGAVAEAMRQDPRAIRSNHFTHSVSAIGKRARELTENHGQGQAFPTPWSDTAFAEVSPWTKMLQWNGLMAFIGVAMNSCTMKHWIEARMVAGILRQLPQELQLPCRNQLAHDCQGGLWGYYDSKSMGPVLEDMGFIRRAPLGATHVIAIRTRTLVEEAGKLLAENPARWLSPEFLAWRDQALSHRI